MRLVTRLGWGLIALGSVALHAAPATSGTDGDPADSLWRARIQQQFRHVRGLGFPHKHWYRVDSTLIAQDHACLRRIALLPWRLEVNVPGTGGGVFASLRMTFARLSDPSQDVYQGLRGAPDRPDGACRATGKEALAYLRTGPFWIRVLGSCGDGDIFDYEVGEVLNMVAATPEGLPAEILYTPCGRRRYELIPSAPFLARLREPRSFWGKAFPAARERERKRLLGAR